MKLKDFLKNKKVVFYGDSITHNFDKYTHDLVLVHGENYEYGLGSNYVKMLDDVCHFKTVDNFAVSGGCYANVYKRSKNREPFRHFGYQVYHTIDKLKEAEVIFVFYGANDYTEQPTFGDFNDCASSFDDDNMTFYGGMNLGFRKIKEENPNATIIVINILNQTIPTNPNVMYQYSINEYNLAISHICRLYGMHLIDVSNLFKVPENYPGGKGPLYTDDGLHPNHDGYVVFTNYLLESEI